MLVRSRSSSSNNKSLVDLMFARLDDICIKNSFCSIFSAETLFKRSWYCFFIFCFATDILAYSSWYESWSFVMAFLDSNISFSHCSISSLEPMRRILDIVDAALGEFKLSDSHSDTVLSILHWSVGSVFNEGVCKS